MKERKERSPIFHRNRGIKGVSTGSLTLSLENGDGHGIERGICIRLFISFIRSARPLGWVDGSEQESLRLDHDFFLVCVCVCVCE